MTPLPKADDDTVKQDDPPTPDFGPFAGGGWRIEILDVGKRFIYRQGGGGVRQAKKGGSFDQLSDERKKQYEQNRDDQRRTKAAAAAARQL